MPAACNFATAPHNVLAIRTWSKSAMHGHYGEDKVVSQVVGDTLSAIEAR
jgi:hypothetical protein